MALGRRPNLPPDWKGPRGLFQSRPGFDTSPKIYNIDPNSDRVDGGTSVTITGDNFRYATDGSAPVVTFDGVPATNVVVVDAQHLTATTPAFPTAKIVDVTVTEGSQSATLREGFTFFSGTITSLDPEFGPITGGTDIVVHGVNFIAGSTFKFGGVPGTNPVFIDSEHYQITTPANPIPYFVDVTVTEPLGSVTTFRSGFKYTTLTRGNDFRRLPGIQIRDVLNNTPNTCSLSIDGASNRPQEGEEVHILDVEDGNRVMFAGTVQTVDQDYEEQMNQLVWATTLTDFTWLLNRKRPFGRYENVSVSLIVVDLMARYAPEFTVAHVQTLLAPITVEFDGTKDLVSCLSQMAQQIGGGHWYVDYTKDMHFFHVKPPALRPLSGLSPGPGTPITLSEGAALPGTTSFPPAYVYVRTTFLYSNGVESRLGPTSNVVAFAGKSKLHLAVIPIGADPGGGVTCIARRVYFALGAGPLLRGWKISNNTDTDLQVYFNQSDEGDVHYEGTAGLVVAILPPPPAPSRPPVVIGGPAISGYTFPTDGSVYTFLAAAVYEDGTETLPSPVSNKVLLGDDYTIDNSGTIPRGKGPKFTSLPTFPQINGVDPIAYKIFFFRTAPQLFSATFSAPV